MADEQNTHEGGEDKGASEHINLKVVSQVKFAILIIIIIFDNINISHPAIINAILGRQRSLF